MLYTIRVELHGANAAHYVELAKKLAAAGIVDTVRGDGNGVTYKLPPAEYACESSETIEAIRQKCSDIAASVKRPYAILVTQGARAWVGLDRVK